MLQLFCQLDMDRMDYLKRDSFIQVWPKECKLRTIDSNDELDDVWLSKKRIYSVEIFDVQTINVLASVFA
jgi:HD superfamily phosphohydrolase